MLESISISVTLLLKCAYSIFNRCVVFIVIDKSFCIII